MSLQWNLLKAIQQDYEFLYSDAFKIENEQLINYDDFKYIMNKIISSKISFIKGTRERLLDIEIARASNWEEYITKQMEQLVATTNGQFFEFEHRKKSRESLDEKYQNTKMTEDKKDKTTGLIDIYCLEKALHKIHDNVRYTIKYKFDEYVVKYFEAQKYLKSKNFETVKVKNTWLQPDSYKGINTIVKCHNDEINKDYLFELQFHNEVSTKAKDDTHEDYEIYRNEIKYDERERYEAGERRKAIFNAMPIPKDIDKIINFDTIG